MRLFIALPMPPEALPHLVAVQSRLSVGRPVAEENLHLTLAFLGDQTENTAETLHDALDGLRAPAVQLTLRGAAVFGGRRGQAIGLEAEGGAALTDLQSRIMSRLRGCGVDMERRRFRPHVTLARLKGGRNASPGLSTLAGQVMGPFTCTQFALMHSELHRDGAHYEVLAGYPLTTV